MIKRRMLSLIKGTIWESMVLLSRSTAAPDNPRMKARACVPMNCNKRYFHMDGISEILHDKMCTVKHEKGDVVDCIRT